MKNTKKMSRVEQALQNMRDEIKNAILNEEIEMEFMPYPYDSGSYYAELHAKVADVRFEFAIADTFVCYRNDFTNGIFPEGSEDFARLTAVTRKHVKKLSTEDRERIKKLREEIENIKKGKE